MTPLASNPPFSTAVSYNGDAIPVSQLHADAKASGIALAMVNPKYSNAYMETYNLNLQQALGWGMVASIYYAGSEGKHLLIQTNANQVVGATSKTQVHPFTNLSANSPVDPGKRSHRISEKGTASAIQITTRCGPYSTRLWEMALSSA